MKTKKFLAGISAFVFAASAASVQAFAEPAEQPDTRGTDIAYNFGAGYTVTIPASVNVTSGDVTEQIVFENVVLGNGQSIVVTLTDSAKTPDVDTDDFVMKTSDNTAETTYNIKNAAGTKLKRGDIAASFTYNGEVGSGTSNITFTQPTNAAFAGSYSDQLTFTISVEDVT